MALDGSMNGTWGLALVHEVLTETRKPSDNVIMAILAAHKSAPIRDAIEAVVARLLALPPNSCKPSRPGLIRRRPSRSQLKWGCISLAAKLIVRAAKT